MAFKYERLQDLIREALNSIKVGDDKEYVDYIILKSWADELTIWLGPDKQIWRLDMQFQRKGLASEKLKTLFDYVSNPRYLSLETKNLELIISDYGALGKKKIEAIMPCEIPEAQAKKISSILDALGILYDLKKDYLAVAKEQAIDWKNLTARVHNNWDAIHRVYCSSDERIFYVGKTMISLGCCLFKKSQSKERSELEKFANIYEQLREKIPKRWKIVKHIHKIQSKDEKRNNAARIKRK